MKKKLLVGVLLLSTALAHAKSKAVETLVYDFDRDGKEDKITLSIPAERTDPGEFTDIEFKLSKSGAKKISNEDGWVSFTQSAGNKAIAWAERNKLVRSDRVIAVPEPDGRILLFLTGYAYASAPGVFEVLRVDKSGVTPLFKKEFQISEFKKAPSGAVEMTGVTCFSQVWGKDAQCSTYDPFVVFTIDKTVRLNEAATKATNLARYAGYAGSECSEDIAVLTKNGQRTIIQKPAADKLCNE